MMSRLFRAGCRRLPARRAPAAAAPPDGHLRIQGSNDNYQPMRWGAAIQCVGFKQGTNMADISMNIVLEGALKHRDGKKWKPRWCVIRKLSPVADRLHISLYRDAADYIKNSPEKTALPLEDFLGIESCFTLDKEPHVMAIVCLHDVTLLAFQGRETLIEWEIRIRSHLGEEHQYPAQLVKTPLQNKLTLGSVKFYIQGSRIGMTSGTPPRLMGSWNIAELRKFGVVENKLCFEVGSRCGKVSGLYVLMTEQGQDIADRMSQASESKHSKNKSSKRRYKLCCHSIILDDMSSISGLSRISGMSTPPPEDFAKDFRDTEVYADLNFISEPSPLTGSSVETTSTIFSDSSSDSERHKLVSIENLLGADNRSICDVPVHARRDHTLEGVASNNLNFDDTLRRNELEDTNTLPRGTLRDELNISPELDDSDGCGMILDNDAFRLVTAEDGMTYSKSNTSKTRLGSTTSSQSHTSGGSSSSVNAVQIFPADSSGPVTSQPLVSPATSSNGLDNFLSTVHRNVDALSPKQPKCDQAKVSEVLVSCTGPEPTTSNGGGSCVFESHGQLREPDTESLDLLDEVLRACNVDAFSSSSGGHSSLGSRGELGVHSIHSSTCSIGSANQAGEGLSDGSNRTSPAQSGSTRTSPARNSPVNTNQSLHVTQHNPTATTSHTQASQGPPLLVPRSKSLHQSSLLPFGIQISSEKCHNHSYVNVSGINSVLESSDRSQATAGQNQQPVPSVFLDHSSSKGSSLSNSDPMNSYHDYVNVPALNGKSAPEVASSSHPSMQYQLSTPLMRPVSNWNRDVSPASKDRRANLDPNQPLPYVDLNCYDNDEEGYLYWVKGATDMAEAPVILTNPGTKSDAKKYSNDSDYLPMKGATASEAEAQGLYNRSGNKSQPNLSQYEHDHQDYVNMPTSTAKSVMAKLSAVRGKLLAYHDSLRRSRKPQVRRNTVDGSSKSATSPKHSPKSSPKGSPKRSPKGSPKSDRNSLRTELFRSRGKSLEDILDASIKQRGGTSRADFFNLAPVEGRNNWSIQAQRPDSAEGEYIQLTLSDSDRAALLQMRDRHMSQAAAKSVQEEESTYILMTSDNRSSVSSPSSAYIQMDTGGPSTSLGLDASYAVMSASGVISNPFAKSPSPIRSPRSLRRTPPSVGATSPHTSPKKVHTQHGSEHSNYMMMAGHPKDDDDNAVFCAMELPIRSASSASHYSIRSRNCSFSSTASSDTYHDESNYLGLNKGRQRSNSSLGLRPVNRPPLNQSKSLDMDYDGDYLHMAVGADVTARGAKHGDYMCMNPSRDAGAVGASTEATPVRPFDDLIEHESFVSKKPLIPPKPPTLTRKSSDAPLTSKSEDSVKSPPTGKKDRFLSRLIRRNSSKERKNSQSKSQEDILKSPVVETLPEVPISEPNTPSPYKTRMGQDPFGLCPSPNPRMRRASVDTPPSSSVSGRGRSASYSYQQGWLSEESNLTDEQKQRSCISVASSSSSRHPSPRSDSPPILPPRTYLRHSTESPAYMLVLPKKRPTPPPPPVESPEKSNSPDLDFLDRPISPNMPTELAPPPPGYPQGSDTTLAYTDSNPNSANTSTLTLLHISEEDDLRSDPPPELPEKTHRRKSSPGVMLSSSLSLLRRQTSRHCPSPTWHSQSELLLTDDSKASSACVSPMPGARSRRDAQLTVHIPINGEEEIDELMGNKSNSSSRVSTPTNRDDTRPMSRQHVKTDSSETQSLSSYGSADTTSTRSDDHKASPASTTLRPRFGKEYKKLDRRKLADELSIGGYATDGLRTPGSPSVASSVFTFDTTSLSSRMSSISGYSLGNDSPRSPPHIGPPPRSPAQPPGRMPHDYVNVCMPRTDSPRFWDMTPPGSPRSLSGASEQSNPLLNYAEIDLSQTVGDPTRPRKPMRSSDIEYAMIDMVATAAASRAGKEHAQLREDSLRRKDGRRGEGDSSQEYIRRSKIERKNSSVSSSGRSEKKPSSRSGSKDRKFSAPT